jgi:TolB-like protein/tetratricopeptide (TPR) repeat protein
MSKARAKRRLAAILAADVVGYSRLMGVDEEGTLTTLKTYRHEVIDPKIAEHGGRIVKTMGDGVLVEFSSAVEAVRCADEIQRGMLERNTSMPRDKRVEFRIGIHVGDIIIEDGDIFGDGVNIAARLEGIAQPGGICISEDAYRQVRGKFAANFQDAGEHKLKNIAQPVRVYQLQAGGDAKEASTPALPDNPSVAVLPFTNLSRDPEQEYFADGITEDLTMALSNVRSFFVIDRSSSFTYKGQSVDVREVGRRLKVRYVLEGSVRKAGDKLRVSAQLVEVLSGNQVWADRFDGDLREIFDLQDKIVASVVGALEPQLLRAELERVRQKRPDNFDAYDLTLCGLSHMNKLTPEDTAAALNYFRRAIDADPNYARAYACACWCYRRKVQLRGMILSEEEKTESLRLARAALQADSTDPYVLWQVGFAFALIDKDMEGGLSLIDRSLAANPNSNRALLTSASVRVLSGDPQTAIKHAERAIQLSPLDISMWVAFGVLANAHAQLAHYQEAVVWARRSVRLHRDHILAHIALIASLAQIDQQQEAEKALSELQKVEPDLTLTSIQQRFPLDRFQNYQSLIEGLSKAGLPA